MSSNTCIKDFGPCQWFSTTEWCCSGHCVQNEGEEFGKCAASSTPEPGPITTPTSCLGEGVKCAPDGSLGNCCSFNCFKLAHEEYGKCRGSEPPTDIPPTCIRKGGNCTLVEGLPLGLCCRGLTCDVLAPHIYGTCEPIESETPPPQSGAWIIYTSVGVSAIFVLLVGGFIWLYCRQKKIEDSLSQKELKHFFYGDPKSSYLNGYAHEATDNLPYNKELEIPRCEFTIDMNSQLGAGCFGLVLKGVVRGDEVAVKTVKNETNSGSHLRSLLSEIKVLQYIGQFENVVSIVGCYTENLEKEKIFLFLEYCPLGSLDMYLRKFRRTHDSNSQGYSDRTVWLYEDPSVTTNSDETELDLNLLLQWCLQITNAMRFLEKKKVIHADLATRNVLLLRKDCAKLTDFGLSRKLYEYGSYVKKNQEPLPWRWLALECLTQLTFSHKSDVWALGVTFWEIFSLGEIPYPGMEWSQNFLASLRGGLRPSKPAHSSDDLYDLMLDCWKPIPESRPTFEEIYNRLQVHDCSMEEGREPILKHSQSYVEVQLG